jgi:predicted ATP-grasp superfamily ATP-dependent carboligase
MTSHLQAFADTTLAPNHEARTAAPQPALSLGGLDSGTHTEKVLVLDGNTRSALAATRSLGRKGVWVVAADESKRTLSGISIYCSETFTYPSPSTDPQAFLATIKAECAARGITVLFPMTEVSTATVLKNRQEFEGIKIPFVEFETFDAISDKWRLLELAQRLDVPIPKTHFVEGTSALSRIFPRLSFPVVLKPYRSRIWSNGRYISAAVKYANSLGELEETVSHHEYFSQHPFLIQEYVSGQGQGVFALYDRGQALAFFSHRRLREKPPSGGVSVLCESVKVNPEALRMARAILDHVRWHGVAMVEFKIARDGTPFLMEINGRFWGSLQLAVDAGVDFPWLLFQLATGRNFDYVNSYAVGVRSRWLLGDFISLCKVLVANGSLPHGTQPGKMQSLIQFLRIFDKQTRYEINRWDDVKPFFFELVQRLRR